MQFSQVIDSIRDYLQMSSFVPDETGTYAVVFDGGLDVEFVQLGGTHLLLRSKLLDLPSDEPKRTELLQQYLQHSLAQLREHRATVSLDRQQNSLWLSHLQPMSRLNAQLAISTLEDFVNALDWWRRAAQPVTSSAFPFSMIRP